MIQPADRRSTPYSSPGYLSMQERGTIWWDFDGTLVRRPFMWSDAGYRCLRRISQKTPIPLEDVKQGTRSGFPWHRPEQGHPELSTADLWWKCVYRRYVEIFADLGCQVSDDDPVFSDIRRTIIDPNAYALFDDVLPALQHLRDAGWRHVMVSNHVPELPDIVHGLGIAPFFHAIITSAVVGYEKPHARIFETALTHSVPARPIWMIGDNAQADCYPVGAFGAQAILVRSTSGYDRCAADLRAALGIIDSAAGGDRRTRT